MCMNKRGEGLNSTRMTICMWGMNGRGTKADIDELSYPENLSQPLLLTT